LGAAEYHGAVQFGGLPVPGASVTASQGDKKFSAITDDQGFYSFPDLPDGVWTIRVEMLCFAALEEEVGVAPGAPAREWDLKMLPLSQIRAEAPAPASASVAAPAAQSAAVPSITAAQPAAAKGKKSAAAKNAPPVEANTPSAFQRANVNASAGAAEAGSESGATEAETSQVPSDGFLINGSVNNGNASPFAQSAAFGNYRRSVRSLYSGNLGLQMDNSFWDARAYSLTGQNVPKPAYERVQGMASFGGPLKIPFLVKRNGPNITLNYQWARNRNANTQTTLVPTALERSGDLSQTLSLLGRQAVIYDPTNGAPFPNNAIPGDRLSSQAKALMGFYPNPGFNSGALYNYEVPLTSATHADNLQGRIQKSIKTKNQISGNFAWQNARIDNTNVFGFLDTTNVSGVNGQANWVHRFTMRSFLTLGYQYSRSATRVTPFFAYRQNISGDAGIAGNNQDPANWGPPSLAFSNGTAGLSDAQSSFTRNQTSGTSASLFWMHGSHNVTAGADFRRQQFNLLSQQDARGTFTFTGAATGTLAGGVLTPGTGSPFADFLLGIPDTSSIAFGNADKYLRASVYDASFNDDWRVSAALTVNAGVRWGYGSPVTELRGRLVNLDIAPGYAAAVAVVSGDPHGPLTGLAYPDSLVNPDKHAFQPRIGLAWRPFLASSMVIRAGYGVYYNTSVYEPIATQMAQQAPLSKSLSVQNSAAYPLTLANGFNTTGGSTPNTFAVDPSFRVGYSQNWQVSIQRDLPGSLIATATYLGTKGMREQQEFLPNTYPIGAANPCPTCLAGYAYLTSNGNSTREAGQFQLRRRLRAGLTAQIQYVYAKAIDDAALGGGTTVIAQNWLDLSGERGLSNFDQRHQVSFQAQYTTGMGLGGGTLTGGWKGSLLHDWTFLTLIAAGTGLPLTPIYLAAVPGTGVTGSIRPDFTGTPLYAAPPGRFLNPAAIAPPATGQWGDAGRNSITGPNQFSLNASMARTFRVSDRTSADVRFDATNALNHVTYASYVTTATGSQFGLPASPNAMRTVQIGLRVRF
jgi:hypothetical protein